MSFDAGSVKAKMVLDKSQFEKSAMAVGKSQQKMTSQAKKTGTAMKGMWKQMAIGLGVTGGITMVVRGLMRQMSDTIKTGRSFEKEWANVTTMLDISRSATEKMKHELRMLSPTLGDTTDLAKGMYQVLSASIEPAKAIRFLGEAAKSAKAGVTDTKTAVDALTTVINAYGMEAEDVTDISDIMFATVKRGKLTYEELAHSLGTVVPVAATVGVEFKEIAAATATLTRQGINAGKATMQLRQVMMAVLKPSEEAIETAARLGIEFTSTALRTKGLSKFLFDVKEKTKGSSDDMAKLVPNVRALTAVMALAGEQADELAYDVEFMGEALGLTDEAFRKQMESIDFWLETFETAADKIKIAIYEGLTSQLRESIRTTEDFDKVVTEKTNSAANAVSLHVSMMIENLQSLGKAFKKTEKFFPVPGLIFRLIKGKDATDDLAEAHVKLRDAMIRTVSKEAIKNIEGFKEANEYLKIAIDETLESTESLLRLDMKIDWEGLMPPSELMARWENFYNLVETPELDLIWEQQMLNMEEDTLNFMAKIIPGMEFMTKSITDDSKTMAKNTKLSFTDMAMTAGNVLTAIAGQSKGLAIAGAVISTYAAAAKTLQTFGWPAAIPFMAAAIASGLAQVAAIKAQDIPSAEKGAYLPSPAIIEAGHGRLGEVILPLDKAPQGIGGAKVDFNFYAPIISTTGIASSDLDKVSEEFFSRMDREARRRGYSLNGS